MDPEELRAKRVEARMYTNLEGNYYRFVQELTPESKNFKKLVAYFAISRNHGVRFFYPVNQTIPPAPGTSQKIQEILGILMDSGLTRTDLLGIVSEFDLLGPEDRDAMLGWLQNIDPSIEEIKERISETGYMLPDLANIVGKYSARRSGTGFRKSPGRKMRKSPRRSRRRSRRSPRRSR